MARGFTLFELLVVLAIMGLIAGLAVPRFAQGRPGQELHRAARELVASLREARGRAIAGNRDVAFVLDPELGGYRIDGDERGLPAGSRLQLDPAASPGFVNDRAAGAIRFFPDGSSDGGRLILVMGAAHRSVQVDWLSGRIEAVERRDAD